jgi:ubiquinone/menaquinone biosynthesis C-methylase UbiE
MKRDINHPFKFILTTRFKVRVLKNLLKNENTKKILDVGCGSGFILSQLESIYDSAVGIDMSPEAIKFGQQFTKAELKMGNAEKMEFSNGEFDCIKRDPLLNP